MRGINQKMEIYVKICNTWPLATFNYIFGKGNLRPFCIILEGGKMRSETLSMKNTKLYKI